MLGVGLPGGAWTSAALQLEALEKLLGLSAEKRPGHSFLIHVTEIEMSQSLMHQESSNGQVPQEEQQLLE